MSRPSLRARPQIFRTRTGSAVNSMEMSSLTNRSSETARETSINHNERINLIKNLTKFKPRQHSLSRENNSFIAKAVLKESFIPSKEKILRPSKPFIKQTLSKPDLPLGPVHNSFYDYMDKMLKTHENLDELKKHITIPSGFFSPMARRA